MTLAFGQIFDGIENSNDLLGPSGYSAVYLFRGSSEGGHAAIAPNPPPSFDDK